VSVSRLVSALSRPLGGQIGEMRCVESIWFMVVQVVVHKIGGVVRLIYSRI